MSRKMLLIALVIWGIMIMVNRGAAFRVQGHCYLENQTNHAGTQVQIQGGRTSYTDSTGLYFFFFIPEGIYNFIYSQPGFQKDTLYSVFVLSDTTLPDVELLELYDVYGYCGLWGAPSYEGTLVSVSGGHSTTTWSSGYYCLQLTAGIYNFSFSHPGYESRAFRDVEIIGFSEMPDIWLVPYTIPIYNNVFGTCRLEDQTNFAGTEVVVSGYWGWLTDTTDYWGQYSFYILESNCNFTFSHEGYATNGFNAPCTTNVTILPTIELQAIQYTVDGYCYLEGTHPLDGTVVHAYGEWGDKYTDTDDDGYFEIEVPGGYCYINLYHDASYTSFTWFVEDPSITNLDPTTLALLDFQVDGFCYLDNQYSYEGTVVTASISGFGYNGTWTDWSGYYSFEVPGGYLRFDFEHDGYFPQYTYLDICSTTTLGDFELRDDPTTPIVLINFSAAVGEQGVCLSWTTASEIECYGWLVQRCLGEVGLWGTTPSWQDISPLIPGFGTSVEPHDYSFIDMTAQAGETYSYRLKQIDLDGSVSYTDPIAVSVSSVLATDYRLPQNFPNPFNLSTLISFALPEATPVNLSIYNVSGRMVTNLVNGWREPGIHEVIFEASGLASGVYLCQLTAGDFTATSKMVLLK